MKQRIFTLRQIIEEGTAALRAAGIEEAALDAWYLFEYTTGISRAAYYGEPGRVLEEEQARRYLEYIGIRKKRVPLQHITGEQEFMGYPFYVNEYVLIPRQDTETLVEEAVKAVRAKQQGRAVCGLQEQGSDEKAQDRRIRVLDMCTGSGCILLSIMKMCPGIAGVGCDISSDALEVAGKNAKRLGVNAEWVQSDLFAGLQRIPKLHDKTDFARQSEPCEKEQGIKYDVIVSNPPYICTSDIEGLQEEVRVHDPRIALDGGEDGLDFYRKITEAGISYIENGGSLLFEIGCDQGEAVARLMKSQGYVCVTVKKDLSGLDRVVTGVYNGCSTCRSGFL